MGPKKQRRANSGKGTKRKFDCDDHFQSKIRKQNESDSDDSEPLLSIEKRGTKRKSDIDTPSCSYKRRNHVSFIDSTQSSVSDSENDSSVNRVKKTNTKLKTQSNLKKSERIKLKGKKINPPKQCFTNLKNPTKKTPKRPRKWKAPKKTPKKAPPVPKRNLVAHQRQQRAKNRAYTVDDVKKALDIFYET